MSGNSGNGSGGGLIPWVRDMIQQASEFLSEGIGLDKAVKLSGNRDNETAQDIFWAVYELQGPEGLGPDGVLEVFTEAGVYADNIRDAFGLVRAAEALEKEEDGDGAMFLLWSIVYPYWRNTSDGKYRYPALPQTEVQRALLCAFGYAPELAPKHHIYYAKLATAHKLLQLRRHSGSLVTPNSGDDESSDKAEPTAITVEVVTGAQLDAENGHAEKPEGDQPKGKKGKKA